jgi:hypothetical protein
VNEPTEQPRTSVEKVLDLLEEINNATPEELAQLLPGGLPPGLVKMALAAVVQSIPDDPAKLDAQLHGIATRLLMLRSDDAPESATHAQLAAAADVPPGATISTSTEP